MPAPGWRALGIAAAGTAGLLLPVATSAATSPTLQQLRDDAASVAAKKRSAVLSLYSLEARVSGAYSRLGALERQAASLRAQRKELVSELRVARRDAKVSQRRLATRLRALYDHGSTSTLEVIFGATSLTQAMDELDNLNRVTSADHDILVQVRAARLHERRVRERLAARERRLAAAVRDAAAEARDLAAVRSERAAYVASLVSRETLDAQRIAGLEAEARAAETKARSLSVSTPAAVTGTPAPTRVPLSGAVVTLVSTGYCLKGRTATGIPVGWGVAAVDPSVIPLGTHLTIPGYGTAVAADTGGSIVGGRIDLWFPTCARAGGWGTRSVTIALH